MTTGTRQIDMIGAPPASIGIRLHALALTVGLIVLTLGVGWLLWSFVEWRRSSTPSYRLTGLRLVRRSDGNPAGLVRVLLREVCCLVLMVPTIVVCGALGITFVMGASPPDDLVSASRHAPWDALSGTEVVRVTPRRPQYSELGVSPYEAAQRN
ncbi:MAG TPA: RDD family protein [Acidimicrobiales bacterium]|nr:RDD family protein [Acidimicrobiales bacterium]